jgi:hypothetical protein
MRLIFLSLLMFSSAAQAMSLDWAGTYRFEYVQIDRPSLTDPSDRKSYGLNALSLTPKIIAADGVNITAKLDVLASQDSTYVNSQAGQLWGYSYALSADNTRKNVTSRSKPATGLNVSQLYLNVEQEYGSLLVGRAPYEFGMGLLYNAGNGPFDHWSNSSDVVAYKFIVGNLSFMPMIGRVAAETTAQEKTIQDEILQFQYDSKDTGSMIGFVMARRRSSAPVNDTPIGVSQVGGLGATVVDPYSMQTNSFILGRTWESFKFRMEAAFMNGDYGVRTAAGENVKNNSYGIGIEMEFPRPESKWEASLKLGVASGDDASTVDREGFFFDRNYDVAMLLFNHRMGKEDFLGTNLIKDTSTHTLSNSIDDETISNAAYLAPKLRYTINERWDLNNTLIYAQLMSNSTNSLDFKKELGLEWDIELAYKPRTNVRWVNQLGMLMPGAAFKQGPVDYTTGFNFGFETKAAITF